MKKFMHGTRGFMGQFVRKFSSYKFVLQNLNEESFSNNALYMCTGGA